MRRLAATALLLAGTAAFADSVSDGLAWLLAQQAADGSFGGGTNEQKVLATAEALDTLRAVGQGDTLAAHYAELYLAISPRAPDAEVELRRERALASTGQAIPIKRRTAHAAGFEHADPLHLALTLRADVASGTAASEAAFLALLDLRARLQTSGCWRWVENDDSAELTAAAVQSVRAYLDVPTPGLASNGFANFVLQEGARCLRASNGSHATLGATAMALEALLVAPGSNTTAIANARAALQLAQASDGSIGGSVRVTAIALRGLLAGKPDWRITPDDFNRPVLVMEDPSPLAGVDAVARLDVENRSGSPAPATTVRFILQAAGGGAPFVGADVALPALAPGQLVPVTALIPTAALQGDYTVRAVVDPADAVAEISEANNMASAGLRVRAEADLALTPSSIRFISAGPGQVNVEVSVRNLGVPLAQPVSVGVWKGNPSSGGVRIGGATLAAGLATNGVAPVTVFWNTGAVNGATAIFAIADEANVLAEADEANNRTFRFYFPGTANPVDLSVIATEVLISPVSPRSGDLVTFTALIRNFGAFDASRVPVRLSLVNGPPLAQVEVSFVPAGGSTVAEFSLVPSGTSVSALVTIDPLNQLNDTNLINNVTRIDFNINQTPGAELEIFSFGEGAGGTTVDVAVRDFGRDVVTTRVSVVDLTHGTDIGSTELTLRSGDFRTLSFAVPAGTSPAVFRACIDPDNLIAEPRESDNCKDVSLSGAQRVDLTLREKDLAFTPVGADVGEKVQLQATVHNVAVGGVARNATAVVEWWHGLPSANNAKLIGTSPVSVAANGTGSVSFDWVRASGPIEVCARVSQVLPADPVETSNLSCRHLFLEQVVNLQPGTTFQSGASPRVARLTGQAEPELLFLYKHEIFGATQGVAAMRRDASGAYVELWRAATPDADRVPTDLVVADFDHDGSAEVAVFIGTLTSHGLAPRSEVKVYGPTGALKWTQGFTPSVGQWGNHFIEGVGGQLALGDVDGDGTADLITVEATVRVFSGDDGHVVWTAPNPTLGQIQANCTAVVLDVEGDAVNEVLVNCGDTFLLSSTGVQRWTTPSNCSQHIAVTDLDLDGSPEGIRNCNGRLNALDLRTGAVSLASSGAVRIWEAALAPVGAAMQDGLPYVIGSDNSSSTTMFGFHPNFAVLWQQSVARPDNIDVYAGSLADLVGLGRPQFIGTSGNRAMLLQDTRNGKLLLEVPASGFGGQPGSSFTHSGDFAPVVAGLGGGASVLVTQASGDIEAGPLHHGAGELLILSSPHWKPQPALWPTRWIRKGQVDETTLRVSNDYRWWTTHNTWNQQFDVVPAKLLADLTVASLTATPVVAGAVATLTATVKNVGGLPASNIEVSFYDGTRLLGSAVASGPAGARGGTATATFAWSAFPEGQHELSAVANLGRAIEEPDYENNSGQVRAFVEPGTQLCDALVDPASLGATPAAPLAGQSVLLVATVRNAGPVACPAHLLTVRDGAGGAVLGTAAVAALAPGALTPVAVTSSLGPGTHLLRFNADEAGVLADGVPGNNVATLVLTVAAATQPDYLVTSLAFSPNPARSGEAVTATAVVRNRGAAATAGSSLLPSLGTAVVVDALGADESKTFTFTFVAPAASATVTARVDADGVLAEFDETNNLFSALLTIEASALSLTGVAVPSTVLPGTSVSFDVAAQVTGASALEVYFSAELRNGSGAVVANVASGRREVLTPGTAALGFAFNAGSLAPGSYLLHVTGTVQGRLAAVTDVALTVLPETAAATALSADRGSYRPGEEAVFTQRTTNASRNAPLDGASLTVRVLSPSAAVLFSTTRQLPVLPAGGFFDTVDLFAISPSLPPGSYSVDSTVRTSGGLVLGIATQPFTVVYQPQDTVRGALTAVNPFPIGPSLNASLLLTNDGAVFLANGTVELSLLNAVSLAVESFGTAPVSLAPGASASVSIPLPTSGIPPGQKLLVARLGGRTLDRLLLLAVPNTDVQPPVILVTGVAEGEFANHDVTPVITVQDQSAFTTSFLLDGFAFSSGSAVTAEGPHVLTLSATDSSGNSAQLIIHFTIDRVAPVLTLNGPADGALLVGPVTLSYSSNEGAVSATVDAASFPSGGTVGADGVHVWTVTATDAAGNTTTATRTFTLDATAPTIAVTGAADGQLLNHAVTVGFSAADAHPGTTSSTLDGAPFSSGATVSSEGTHVLVVTAIDALGNTRSQTVTFVIDLTAPVITVTGVAPNAVRNTPVTLVYSASGASSVSATLDGAPFVSGDTVSTAGDHLLLVTATDLAGNSATQSVPFALDFTAPVISVNGVSSGQLRNTAATITFGSSDAHPGVTSATVDGAPFSSGGTVSAEGDHLLLVSATDAAGNTATQSVPFSLDFTAPVITILGVVAGSVRNTPATVTFGATDAHPGAVSATLDGAPFTSGTTVAAPGNHTLVVSTTDGAGNSATQTLAFSIDVAAPVITVSGINAGTVRNTPPTISFSATDAHPGTATATLDGAAFTSGSTVSTAGDHLLVVSATDAAGNSASVSVPFSLDFTAPVITISGVTEGASGASFTPVFSATDAHSVSVSATLDGVAFSSGTTVSAAGAHTLAVTATDGAGNTATVTRHFTVTGGGTTSVPVFHYAVCAFGALTVSNNALVTGAPSAAVATQGAFTLQNNARIGGAVVTAGNALLKNNALVDGRVYHSGTFTQQNNALASGGHQTVSPAPSPCECGFDLSAALADAAATNNNNLLAGNPAYSNGVLTVQNNATVTLAAGRYFLQSLELKNNAKLTAPAGAQVRLYVQGAVAMGNNSTVGAPVGSPAMLLVSGGTTVQLKNNTDAALHLYAPNAAVALGNNSKLHGAVVGNAVTLSNNQRVELSGFTQSTPPPLTCP